MAALAVAITLVGFLASFGTTGWIIPGRTAGIAALILGGIALAVPGDVGALERPRAAATMLWGATFIVVAPRSPRQRRRLIGIRGELRFSAQGVDLPGRGSRAGEISGCGCVTIGRSRRPRPGAR